MNKAEVEEREFSINESGKVIDDFGNEYRNEQGQIEYIKNENEIRRQL